MSNIFVILYYFTAPQSRRGITRHLCVFPSVDVLVPEATVVVRLVGLVSEVVCHPADRLDVGVLRLPLHVGAVVSPLHNVHAATVVGLLVQHPAVWKQ